MSLRLWQQKRNPPKDVDVSFEGKTIIITGASSGLGYEAALKFARKGASRLIMAVRNTKKGEAAKESMESALGGNNRTNIEVWELEMGDYESIKRFANRAEGLERLDIALLNAGVIAKEYRKEKYGFETTIQINMISTTLLALLLLPKLRQSRTTDHTPVLEIVSSGLYPGASAPSTNPLQAFNKPDGYEYQKQYDGSKLLLHCCIKKLAKLVQPTPQSTPEVIVIGVCPGACASELARELLDSAVMKIFASVYFGLFFRTAEQGATGFISGVVQGPESNGGFWKEDHLNP